MKPRRLSGPYAHNTLHVSFNLAATTSGKKPDETSKSSPQLAQLEFDQGVAFLGKCEKLKPEPMGECITIALTQNKQTRCQAQEEFAKQAAGPSIDFKFVFEAFEVSAPIFECILLEILNCKSLKFSSENIYRNERRVNK